jgi:hypothetical protein
VVWIGECTGRPDLTVRRTSLYPYRPLLDLMADMMVLKSRLPHGIISRFQFVVVPCNIRR